MTKRIFFIFGSLVLIGALLGACGGAPATDTPTPDAVEAAVRDLAGVIREILGPTER